MTATMVRRLELLEDRTWVRQRHREEAACAALLDTMADDHRQILADWRRRPEVVEDYRLRSGDTVLGRLLRLRPPALVRAAYMLLVWHLCDGTPLTLPDYVAEIYVDDPDALPGNACDDCGYYMPVRGRLLPTGQVKYGEDRYFGPCPVCAGYQNGQGGTEG